MGQKVWLSTSNIPLQSISNKSAPKFTKIISPVTVRLKLPPAYMRIHPAFHVSKIKTVFYACINPPTPSTLVDGEPTYSFNRILDSRWRGRGFQYLVDWKGYGPEERSWVPARDILDHLIGYLIDDYNQQFLCHSLLLPTRQHHPDYSPSLCHQLNSSPLHHHHGLSLSHRPCLFVYSDSYLPIKLVNLHLLPDCPFTYHHRYQHNNTLNKISSTYRCIK
ncbi:uncharacterized protein LOC127968125 [Carassius gibelio]|uniref:uncharacterized protein LOC127968125 n=1 Tax=Carassius gibelio TaxID=101364 RepID=UPI0022797EBA|nr:uncharacterized protein LOC127968125 [Carassius gibelio]